MNGTIAKYFKSPKGEDGQQKASSSGEEESKKDEEVVEPSRVEEPEPGPSKPSKSDVDRLIAENMASVLKSLKKKRSHRCSKRKRNEEHREKGEAPAEDDGSESSRHTSPRKSKENPVPTDPPPDLPVQDPPKEGSNKENKRVNAFQLMMASRNKAIGSNSPGRDTNSDAPPDPVEAQKKDEKVKRKLKLEEWADRKGAGKRKLQDEAQEEYIEHQMKRRAKRLKKLIKNMEDEDEEEVEVVPPEPVLRESPRKSGRKTTKDLPEAAVPLKVSAKRGRRRLSSEDSRQVPSSEVATPEQSPTKKSGEDEAFVTKLSSPLKKKDSLLGYFAKVGKSPSSEAEPEVTTQIVAEVRKRKGRK